MSLTENSKQGGFMQQALRITFKDIPRSAAVETHIREHVDKLEQFSQGIISCSVVIEQPQRHQSQGKLFNIHIKLNVPGKELVATNNAQEDIYVSIRDAFDDMRKQLQTYKDQQKGQVKTHSEVLHGKIVRIFEEDGFGFIESNGDEYYFNSGNVVSPKFDKLEIGHEVSFIEELTGQGPQARRVTAKKVRETLQ
jgi:ribosomal subunit interface protein